MKVDGHPFSAGTNMVDISLLKGKAKVLTLPRANESEAVDPEVQLSTDEFKEARRHHTTQKSRCEQGEGSKSGAGDRPRVTTQMLLKKYQRQQEKEYQHRLEQEEYQHR